MAKGKRVSFVTKGGKRVSFIAKGSKKKKRRKKRSRKRTTRARRPRKAPKRRKRRTVARRRRKKGYRKKTYFRLGIMGGLAAGFVGAAARRNPMRDPVGFAGELVSSYTGYDPVRGGFNPANLSYGLLPLIAGLAVSKGVGSYLGVNRMLGSARVPLIRL